MQLLKGFYFLGGSPVRSIYVKRKKIQVTSIIMRRKEKGKEGYKKDSTKFCSEYKL